VFYFEKQDMENMRPFENNNILKYEHVLDTGEHPDDYMFQKIISI
jgi:hypothetical protein